MTGDAVFMRRALEIAEDGMAGGEMPIGAVVVLDGKVIAEAHTAERSQRRLLVHADLLALDAADRILGFDRSRATLYVTLEPCLMCLGAAFTARIGCVVYALESPADGGCETFELWDVGRNSSEMPGYVLPELRGGILRSESADLFRRYADEAPNDWARDFAAGLALLGAAE